MVKKCEIDEGWAIKIGGDICASTLRSSRVEAILNHLSWCCAHPLSDYSPDGGKTFEEQWELHQQFVTVRCVKVKLVEIENPTCQGFFTKEKPLIREDRVKAQDRAVDDLYKTGDQGGQK